MKVQHPGIVAGRRERPRERGHPRGLHRGARRQALRDEEDVRGRPGPVPRGARLRARGDAPLERSPSCTRAIRRCASRGSFASHSARRVLTTELARGSTFDEACAAPVEARRAWAETMWRFVFKGTLRGAMLNADPHPGNYIFHDGRRRHLPRLRLRPGGRRGRTASAPRRCTAPRSLATRRPSDRPSPTLVKSKPGALEKLAIAYSRKCFEPLFDVAVPHHAGATRRASSTG